MIPGSAIRFLFLVFCMLLHGSAWAQVHGDLKLTEEEQNWLLAHPKLKVGVEMNWAPINYSEDGEAKGYAIGVISLVAEKTGMELDFVMGYSWEELLEQFRVGKIDIMPAIGVIEERRAYAEFTDAFYTLTAGIVVNSDRYDITNIASLSGKRVAGIPGYMITRAFELQFPEVQIIPVAHVRDALKAVSDGQADALVMDVGVMRYLVDELSISNLKVIGGGGMSLVSSPDMRMAVAKDNTVLLSILNKGLASIDILEERQIYNRWIPVTASQEEILLSTAQQQWINEHPRIRMGVDPSFAPYSYLDRAGNIIGVAPDFIELIGGKLSIEFELITDLVWADIVKASRKRTLDVIATASTNLPSKNVPKTPEILINKGLLLVRLFDID